MGRENIFEDKSVSIETNNERKKVGVTRSCNWFFLYQFQKPDSITNERKEQQRKQDNK